MNFEGNRPGSILRKDAQRCEDGNAAGVADVISKLVWTHRPAREYQARYPVGSCPRLDDQTRPDASGKMGTQCRLAVDDETKTLGTENRIYSMVKGKHDTIFEEDVCYHALSP